MAHRDPTADEMRAFLLSQPFGDETDPFDREEAIYWSANDYHGGQASNLYSALCMSQYHPGAITNGPEEGSVAEYCYVELEHEYAAPAPPITASAEE